MEREDWDRRYRGTELVWTAQPNRFVVQELSGVPSGRALDLGSGEGRNAVWLAEGAGMVQQQLADRPQLLAKLSG